MQPCATNTVVLLLPKAEWFDESLRDSGVSNAASAVIYSRRWHATYQRCVSQSDRETGKEGDEENSGSTASGGQVVPCSAADSADGKGKTRVVPSAAADGRGKQCGGGYIEGGGQVVPGSAADDGFPTSMFDEKGHR